MPPLSPDLIPKAQRLIRLMATDSDGEALAAVRAMGRLLKSNGSDFNDLAEAIEPTASAPKPATSQPWWAPGYRPEYDWSDWDPNRYDTAPRGTCPTWSTLRPFERRDWANVIVRKFEIRGDLDRKQMIKLRFKIVNEQQISTLTRDEERRFDRLLRGAWNAGLRP